MKDEIYIKRCLDLARLARGYVSPNPIVGAVIVYKNKIIGEGFHQKVGTAHAEINAINSVVDKSLLSKATIYVSLEPCHHYGRTPPCVDSLLKHQFPRVVISVTDPNPKVMGKSIQKLKAQGVAVTTYVLEKEGRARINFFLAHFEQKRPYIILKYAKSSNHVFGVSNQQVWITNPYTKRLVHRWRSEVAAILVATNTALIDNPKLNNRLYYGNTPIRVLLDRQLRVEQQAHLLNDGLPTIVVTDTKQDPVKASNPACEYLYLTFDDSLLDQLMHALHKRGIDSIIIEGGANLLKSFIQKGLWDEARILTGPIVIDSKEAILAPIIKGHLKERLQVGDNQLEIIENYSEQRSENREPVEPPGRIETSSC